MVGKNIPHLTSFDSKHLIRYVPVALLNKIFISEKTRQKVTFKSDVATNSMYLLRFNPFSNIILYKFCFLL